MGDARDSQKTDDATGGQAWETADSTELMPRPSIGVAERRNDLRRRVHDRRGWYEDRCRRQSGRRTGAESRGGRSSAPDFGESQVGQGFLGGCGGNADVDRAIVSSLNYNPSISQTGSPPNGFGVTRPYDFTLSNIDVTLTGDSFTVRATVDNPITYQVRTDLGPSGQVSIESSSDDDISQGNYKQVAGDLTPDMSDLNGRPPREEFWARDLTIRHELFHCTEGRDFARDGVNRAETWLNNQSANNIQGVQDFLSVIPERVAAVRRANMTYPGREERAYGDGAPHYRARAEEIRSKGDDEEFGE